MVKSMEKDALALEYVLGTLPHGERQAFAAGLKTDDVMADEVRYWEVTLAPSPDQVPRLPPKADTYLRITARINARLDRHESVRVTAPWRRFLPWRLAMRCPQATSSPAPMT